ncbi:hypothetical protein [Sphingomonas oligophenolica]|uniref:hypothetical protein n=1 Tax=Sphingomonas oligophenolica TaxID=301154 RepID=UPI00112E5695|nr:hypothetical protein [Sphingomonas oligophenolica]
MTRPDAAAKSDLHREDPAARPMMTRADADADRHARALRHAANCVLLAVVTPPDIAAELIDRAIEHTRCAEGGAAQR